VPPQPREPAQHNNNLAIPLIDLTFDEQPNQFIDVTNDLPNSDNEVEILEIEPPADNLEPLDPDVEFRHNVTQLFIDLEEYARSIFNLPE